MRAFPIPLIINPHILNNDDFCADFKGHMTTEIMRYYQTNDTEEYMLGLKEYIEEDLIYQEYKKGNIKEPNDFEKYCINHIEDIKYVLNLIEEMKQCK